MNRYHPVLVALHWILALMLALGLVMGGNVLSNTPNSDPQKLLFLKIHMSAGITILVLMVLRLVVRLLTKKPAPADIGHSLLNKLGVATHYLLYVLVILIGVSGLVTANLAGLPDVVFGASGVPLPATFDDYPSRVAHGILGFILLLVIIGHVSAFLYHQFLRKERLFSRMWFGKRY
ncbi:MAG: cytochrome b/b6 domain-containing protein [Pseudomonadota bacterium]|nr:cytochrome b/b6 domain-containing protein [Pseudomonadota bacterium]